MANRGTRYLSIDSALKHKSTKLPFPFVIGHDCSIPFKNEDGVECVRKREFYAFNDVNEFLEIRYMYPHAHEMVLDRGTHLQDGRIAFDFDIEEYYYRNVTLLHKKKSSQPQIDSTGTESGYVAPSFELDVEKVVLLTLKKYYQDVDSKKIKFVWMGSKNDKKFSRHLILVGCRMKDDWATQLQSFYSLFRYEAYLSQLFYYFPNIDKLLDNQLAKRNSSLRMCGSKKMKEGAQPLVVMVRNKDNRKLFMPDVLGVSLDRNCIPKMINNQNIECDVSFYDTMIQNLDKTTVMKEQKIPSQKLDLSKIMKLKDEIDEEVEEEDDDIILKKVEDNKNTVNAKEKKRLLKNIPQLRKALEEMDKSSNNDVTINDNDLEIISELDGCFEYRETKGNKIFLNRICSGPCMISGFVHDSDGAYLKVYDNEMIIFYCFRGCTNSQGFAGLIVRKGNGEYTKKQPTKEESMTYLLTLHKEKQNIEEIEKEKEGEDSDEEEEKLIQQMKEAMNNFKKDRKKNKQRGKERRENNKTKRVERHKDMYEGVKFKDEATDVLSSWLSRHN